MEKDQALLILAALLHDIGKFAQRVGAAKSSGQENEYCKWDGKKFSHHHVLYTDAFIEDRDRLPLPQELESRRSELAALAARHHKPATDSLRELALHWADMLSAGTDRIEEIVSEDYKQARLISIFEQVFIHSPSKAKRHRLMPIDQDPFPVPQEEAGNSSYEQLFADFCGALREIPCDFGIRHYLDSLVSLLENYTWCIPSSSYNSLPDVSLYDHAVTTAAIAQALYGHARATGIAPGSGAHKTAKFLLVGGDLSGIQSYIFSLDKSHGAGVAKLFRARSFFLQALTRSVVIDLLERLRLSPVARIMDAGGRFILLVPNTEETRSELSRFELELQKHFFERFMGELSLVLSWDVELTEADLDQKVFPKKLDAFNDSLDRRKTAKFDRLFAEGVPPVFDLDWSEYEKGDCHACRKRPVTTGRDDKLRSGESIEPGLCEECFTQINEIGARLPNTTYMVFRRTQPGNGIRLFGDISLELLSAGKDRISSDSLEIVNIQKRGRFAHQPIAAHLPTMSREELAQWRHEGRLQRQEEGESLGGDEVRVDWPKTFRVMAELSREYAASEDGSGSLEGKAFLGAMKADVDNLGLIFSIGLQERLSISRFATLSRMLNHFFADDLVRFIKREYPNIYIVFAGGDDLFLLGPWLDIVRFTGELGNRFRCYVADNPRVTISAGVAVVKPALPVHSIAGQAADLLEKSKKEKAKASVSLFGTTVGWNECEDLLAKGEWLHKLLKEGAVPTGLVSRLLQYSNEWRRFRMDGEVEHGLYLSHMVYDFARNLKVADQEPEKPDGKGAKLSKEDGEILYGMPQNDFWMKNMRLPASYALYRIR